MKIEDIEELEERCENVGSEADMYYLMERAIAALRSEAWHPIEKAEELGAKDGREIIAYGSYKNGRTDMMLVKFWRLGNAWIDARGLTAIPTHFRFINPP
jgi:hypothetical protein